MNSPRDDDFLRDRIKNGKNGAMPAFGTDLQRRADRRNHQVHPGIEAEPGMTTIGDPNPMQRHAA